MNINTDKTEVMIISKERKSHKLSMNEINGDGKI